MPTANAARWKKSLLTTRDQMLRASRFLSSLLSVALVCILLFLPQANESFFMARLDCRHVNVSNGLFSVLESSISDSTHSKPGGRHSANSSPAESDSFLSTSEIQILAEYTSEKVSNAAQFLDSNLLSWCYGKYDSVEQFDRSTGMFEQIYSNGTSITCSSQHTGYVFDYRGELSSAGLNVILAYAYGSATYNSDTRYVPDPAYLKLLDNRRRRNTAIVGLFSACGIAEAAVAVLGALYYIGCRTNGKVRQHSDKIVNLISLVGFAAFALSFAATLISIWLIRGIREDVSRELGSFGMSVHISAAWLCVAWICVFASGINMFTWGGPIWCATAAPSKEDSENEELHLLRPNGQAENDELNDPTTQHTASWDPSDNTFSTDVSFLGKTPSPAGSSGSARSAGSTEKEPGMEDTTITTTVSTADLGDESFASLNSASDNNNNNNNNGSGDSRKRFLTVPAIQLTDLSSPPPEESHK